MKLRNTAFPGYTALALLLAGCGTAPAAGGPGVPIGRLEAPERLDFGVVSLATPGETSLVLRNAGTGPLEVEPFDAPPPFGGGLRAPALLGPGQSSHVTLTFTPEARGPASAVLRVVAGGTIHELQLEAVGGESPLRCSPGTVELGRPVLGVERSFELDCVNESPHAFEVHAEYDWQLGLTWISSGSVLVRPGATPTPFEFAFRATGTEPVSAAVRLVAGRATLAEVPVHATPIATGVGPIAGLECPAGLDLGFAPPGATTGRTLSVRNSGDRPLRVTAAEVQGSFSLVPAAPFEVPADDPATPEDEGVLDLGVTFAPAAIGPATGTVRLAFDDPGTPEWTGCLSGFGGGPALACSPAALDFGAVASAVPRTEVVTCTNLGTDVPGTLEDRLRLAVTAAGPGFSVEPPDLEGLEVGESVAIAVTFTPPAGGSARGTLTIESNDPMRPRVALPLAADGRLLGPCSYRVEPEALDFGPVAAAGTPATLAVSIFNEGTEDCLVRRLALAGDTDAYSLPAGALDVAVIDPGAALELPVRFSPGAAGVATGALSFAISAPDANSRTVPLSGSTAPAEPCVRVYPESVDFGEVAPGCASLVAELLVVDTCGGVPSAERVQVLGAAEPYSVEWVPPAPPSAGVPARVRIQYRPTAFGEHLAGVRVTTAAEGEGRLVPLRGVAAQPSGRETFRPLSPKIDVLFVAGDGGFSGFNFTPATAWNLDWQFGVTTPSGGLCPASQWPVAQPAEPVADGRLFPLTPSYRPRILTPATPAATTVAFEGLNLGTCPRTPLGLASAVRALTPPLIDRADDPTHADPNDGNLGFLRPDARLAVIVSSSSPDLSPWTAEVYAGALGAVKREAWREPRFAGHAIAGDRVGCSRAPAGDKLIDWTLSAGGYHQSICPPTVPDFSYAVFGRHRFPLKGRPAGAPGPASGDLGIRVNGVLWNVGHWRWDAAANEVVFEPAYAPRPDATVEIGYRPLCVPPAGS